MAQANRGQTAQLYKNMLTGDGRRHIGEETLTRIAAYATIHKDWDLLSYVASVARVGTELDKKLGESTELVVLAAWASRADRPVEELTERLLADKRVSLVQPLASLTTLDASVYRVIGKIKSTKIDETLAGNPAAPLDLRIAKLRRVVERPNMRSRHGVGSRLLRMCSGTDDERNQMLAAITGVARHPDHILLVLEHGHGQNEDIERWINLIRDEMRHGWNAGQIAKLVELLGDRPLTADQRQRLVANSRQVGQTLANTRYQYGAQNVLRAADKAESRQDDINKAINDLLRESDQAKIVETILCIEEIGTGEDRVRMLENLTANPNAPIEATSERYRSMNHSEKRAWILNLENRGEWAALVDLAVAECDHDSTSDWYPPTVIVSMRGESDRVVDGVVDHYKKHGKMLPSWVASTAVFAKEPRLAVELYSLQSAVEAAKSNEHVVKAINSALTRLGDKPEAWETFHTLAMDYHGTLAELIDSVNALG